MLVMATQCIAEYLADIAELAEALGEAHAAAADEQEQPRDDEEPLADRKEQELLKDEPSAEEARKDEPGEQEPREQEHEELTIDDAVVRFLGPIEAELVGRVVPVQDLHRQFVEHIERRGWRISPAARGGKPHGGVTQEHFVGRVVRLYDAKVALLPASVSFKIAPDMVVIGRMVAAGGARRRHGILGSAASGRSSS